VKVLLISFFLLFSQFTIGQNHAVGSQEKLVFTASYKMSGLMTDLAQITMETSEVKTSGNTLFRLKCKAQTYSKWDKFFKIDDLYESYVSTNSRKPYLFKREINEGGYYKFMQYKYIHKEKTVQSIQRKRRKNGTIWEVKKDLSLGSSSLDIVTTIYQIRNLDLEQMAIGSSNEFTLLFDNQETVLKITLLGKEGINTEIGHKECYKLSIAIKNSDVLQGTNSNLLWLTADENKIPVYAKFKVAIGSGTLQIQSATGLKS
jgi:hypothetical protein